MILAAVLAYANSFKGVLLFDDIEAIAQNPHIESIWPLSRSMSAPPNTTLSGRPLVSLSLAVNYAVSERRLWSYHALNLAIHIIAGLTLFGVIRRTLLSRRLKGRFQTSAGWIALACAVIWLVHPLQTQAVTYVIQRCESMAAMFYLLTLYCTIRGADSRRSGLWQAGAVAACAAGMATKETMVTAPLLALIYDRVFLAESLRQIARKRWALYAALAGTWLILAGLVVTGPRQGTAGFALTKFTPLTYAATQCGVILRYIRLAFWPSGQVLDYGWPPVEGLRDFALPAAAMLVILAATVLALFRRPAAGFLGVWFFLILAPTSSFVPIADPIFEHRMYLPLAAIIAAVVTTALFVGKRLTERRRKLGRAVGLASVVAVVAVLALLTHWRNKDYTSQIRMWTDVVGKRPDSRRAHLELALAYLKDNQPERAVECCTRSLEIDPNYHRAYLHRAIAYGQTGRYDRAIADLNRAIRLKSGYYHAYINRAVAYLHKGQWEAAAADFHKALELRPGDRRAMAGLAEARQASRAAAEIRSSGNVPEY